MVQEHGLYHNCFKLDMSDTEGLVLHILLCPEQTNAEAFIEGAANGSLVRSYHSVVSLTSTQPCSGLHSGLHSHGHSFSTHGPLHVQVVLPCSWSCSISSWEESPSCQQLEQES